MRTRLPTAGRAPLVRGALLLAVLAVAATGCADDGRLHDAGLTPAVSEQPTPQLLWPAAATSAPPSPSATAAPAPPAALTGITVTSDRVGDLPVAAVLQRDPAVSADERSALAGCAGCALRPAEFHDLIGDGGSELITALVTPDHAYLHVYALKDRQVLPLLGLTLQPGFTADTIGTDLVVHEPAQATEVVSTYRWDGARLVLKNIQATGPGVGTPLCTPSTAPTPFALPPTGGKPGSGPVVVPPSAAAAAPTAPFGAVVPTKAPRP